MRVAKPEARHSPIRPDARGKASAQATQTATKEEKKRRTGRGKRSAAQRSSSIQAAWKNRLASEADKNPV